MKITELEEPIFSVYPDPEGYGFYAISDSDPAFCIHSPSLNSLGPRVAAALKFYKDKVDRSRQSL